MLFKSEADLKGRSCAFRYLYFIISSCSLKSFASWKREGEPNPFVQSDRRPRMTHRQEIADIFEESLRR